MLCASYCIEATRLHFYFYYCQHADIHCSYPSVPSFRVLSPIFVTLLGSATEHVNSYDRPFQPWRQLQNPVSSTTTLLKILATNPYQR
jgi:hypothetical protein